MEAAPLPEDFVERSESVVCLAGYALPKARLGKIMESPFPEHLICARCLCISSLTHSNPLGWVVSPVLKDWGQPLASRGTQLQVIELLFTPRSG